jgi:hypothetical protein
VSLPWAAPDGTPYRPSNGTEGACFDEGWCSRCHRDEAFRDNPDAADGCEIVARSFALDVGHPEYPKEWIWKDGVPVCTAFAEVDTPLPRITDEERAAQMVLL